MKAKPIENEGLTIIESIAEQNDVFRQAMRHGTVRVRGKAQAASNDVLRRVCAAIRCYAEFEPRDETHDSGIVKVDGIRFRWTIELGGGKPNGLATGATAQVAEKRMLVIMLEQKD